MLVVRPAALADLPQICGLADQSHVGVTSLPTDTAKLREKIIASMTSLEADVVFHGEESYFFVLEDSDTGRLHGCAGIVASAGFSEPFYSYRNDSFVHASREFGIHSKAHVLSLCHDLTGYTLLTSFYIEPGLRNSAVGEGFLRARLMFVANHPARFASHVVAELIGHSDEAGEAPFWNAIGRHFFDVSYDEAERLCSLHSRTFIAELMPSYPVYVSLLPDDAQEVMGAVHPQAALSHDVLLREGFESDRYIDIFDGGPTLKADLASIQTVAHSHLATVAISEQPSGTSSYLISNLGLGGFRAITVQVEWVPDAPIVLSPEAALALAVSEGSSVRVVPLWSTGVQP
ncbi:arginine/ornithine succinyltransferase subunit alpha [Pseudomonas asiatica]|uniref:arginine/ornithine succinyltransferase subunit alpha n=1 Tax=Pseudomonas TaxID=286 RepID=UPI00159676D1|nr:MULTISPECIES: arginine/ornithine succinyltransferase subunit alpha [Pseudomonas]MDD2077013.1 arginine/ornithine succinyltransferase subunit alpha [Pseudomonas putida]QNT40635.1 arginine/ornithine succinyltransferase subunit alpha [Pseudomonas asiatica]HDS1693564.1 arginine/ornithine succinyltransferase subunit alpha [Pseudomonas putida]